MPLRACRAALRCASTLILSRRGQRITNDAAAHSVWINLVAARAYNGR